MYSKYSNLVLKEVRKSDRRKGHNLNVTVRDFVDILRYYEINPVKKYGIDFNKDEQVYSDVFHENCYVSHNSRLPYIAVEKDVGNTYNNGGAVIMQYEFYKIVNVETGKKLDDIIATISFHIGGDVRGNYTYSITCLFPCIDEFFEVLSEPRGSIEFKINNHSVVLDDTSVFAETGHLNVCIYNINDSYNPVLEAYEIYFPICTYETRKAETVKEFKEILLDTKSCYYCDEYKEIAEILNIK